MKDLKEDFFDQIWMNGIIILDTCTLDFIERCDIYRAKMLMDIFLLHKENVYVPNHVKEHEMKAYLDSGKKKIPMIKKVEELKNSIRDIYSINQFDEKKKKQRMISKIDKFMGTIRELEFKGISNDFKNLARKDINSILNYLESEKCMKYIKDYDEFLESETVRNFYEAIMNNVFPAIDADLIKEIKLDGDRRRENNLPPGCGDANKIDNTFGDLIIWKEILLNVKRMGRKVALFITEDKKKKSNWFNEDQTEMHEYLYNEVINDYGYEAINISTLAVFVEAVAKYVNQDIDELVKYLYKQSVKIEDVVTDYLGNQANELLAEKVWESISNYYDIDYSELEPGLDTEIDLNNIEYDIDERVEVTTDVHIEFNVDNNVHWGGDDWTSEGDNVSANLVVRLSIGILEGEYSEEMYSLDVNDIDCEIDLCEIESFDAPFGMDESDEEDLEN